MDLLIFSALIKSSKSYILDGYASSFYFCFSLYLILSLMLMFSSDGGLISF